MITYKTSDTHQPTYIKVAGDIPVDLEAGTFVSLERNTPLKIHSVGFQPAKSIPEIPRWFLKKYTNSNSAVLEPFAGSGTTLIESLLQSCSVAWLDYQPLSRLICRVKTTPINCVTALQVGQEVLKKATAYSANPPSTIVFSNKDFWFQTAVQEGLEILKLFITKTEVIYQEVLWLIFSAVVRKTSNMNDGMILAARRSNVTKIPDYTRADVFKQFENYLEKTVSALAEWQPYLKKSRGCLELATQDARNLESNKSWDAIMTSPPYINAIDYVWASKFELHWLGLIENDQARLDLYAKEIGTERLPLKETKELGKTGNQQLDSLLEDIFFGKKYQASKGQNSLRARVAYKYFHDMKLHFAQSFAVLSSGGHYCFSIGDISTICGVEIPVATILTEMACEVGFKKIFDFHLLLKNRRLNVPRNVNWANTIKHDTIIVLEKPSYAR